jgi:hypothetical protein
MKAMTEEKTFAEKKIRKFNENDAKEKQMHDKQLEFMKQIEKRYQEACQSTKTEVSAKIIQNKDDGLYTVSLTNRPKVEAPEGQIFSLDHPDLVKEPAKLNEEQFNHLREKVGLVHRAMRIEKKGMMIKSKKTQLDDNITDKTIQKLGKPTFYL